MAVVFRCEGCQGHCRYENKGFSGNTINVGYAVKETGWYYIILEDGGSMWLCQDCQERAKPIIASLLEVFGERLEEVYPRSLIRLVKGERK